MESKKGDSQQLPADKVPNPVHEQVDPTKPKPPKSEPYSVNVPRPKDDFVFPGDSRFYSASAS